MVNWLSRLLIFLLLLLLLLLHKYNKQFRLNKWEGKTSSPSGSRTHTLQLQGRASVPTTPHWTDKRLASGNYYHSYSDVQPISMSKHTLQAPGHSVSGCTDLILSFKGPEVNTYTNNKQFRLNKWEGKTSYPSGSRTHTLQLQRRASIPTTPHWTNKRLASGTITIVSPTYSPFLWANIELNQYIHSPSDLGLATYVCS